jgi:hypothetical protein
VVSSYRFSTWRIIICTPVISGEEEFGENQKNKKSNLKLETNKNSRLTLAHFRWVGGLVGLVLLVTAALLPAKAHAADYSWGNVDLAKKTIDNVAPLISENKPQADAASLVFGSDEFLQKPLVVETQITVDPPKPVPKPKVVKSSGIIVASENLGANHAFPYGYCTYYVSQHRDIPWSGNAITWLSGARAYGFATGDVPKVGAILVTSESRAGHVALVESVNDDGTFTVSEMNYEGYGVISTRTISDSYGAIMGFIY